MNSNSKNKIPVRPELRDSGYLAAYIQEQAACGTSALCIALRDAVRAHPGGFTWLSKQIGMSRESLYKALSESGNPSYGTVCRVLGALGISSQTALPELVNTMDTNIVKDKGGFAYYAEDRAADLVDVSQEQYRAMTLELFAESDALERMPEGSTCPDKAQVIDMILEKHRRMGLKV